MNDLPRTPDDPGDDAIRRETEREFRAYGDGPALEEAAKESSVKLTEGGCIASAATRVTRVQFHHCGHPTTEPAGNRCAEAGCNKVSCRGCQADCRRCLKPVCKECRTQLIEQGVPVIYCGRCLAEVRRERLKSTVIKVLLAPFIEEDQP